MLFQVVNFISQFHLTFGLTKVSYVNEKKENALQAYQRLHLFTPARRLGLILP